MEKLSTTDVKCYWATKKKDICEEYSVKPLLETACLANSFPEAEELKLDVEENFFHKVLVACSESALTLHL